jgi:dATP pyrophosphohydrolase
MQTLVVSKVIVVNQDGNVLLIRRSPDDIRRPLEWDVPGGHTDDDEYSAEAAARETSEETGIEIDPRTLQLVYAMTEVPKDVLSVTWVFYTAHVAMPDVSLSNEHVEFTWVPLEKALEEINYERQKRALEYIRSNDLLNATPGSV